MDRAWTHDTHSSMKTRTAAVSARKAIAPFQKGQVWRIGELNVAVTLVGKTLVHHKKGTQHIARLRQLGRVPGQVVQAGPPGQPVLDGLGRLGPLGRG